MPFRLLFALLLALPAPRVALAAQDPPAEALAAAEAEYRAGAYAEAVRIYRDLLERGYEDGDLYYNLGNAHYRLDQIGEAVLAYERALVLDPRDEDARHNLELIRERIPGHIEPLPPFFLRQWWRGLRDAGSPNLWAVLTLALIWLGVGGLVLWLRGPARRWRQWGFALGFSLLLGSVLPFFLAADRAAVLRQSGRAVVLSGEVALRAAPEAHSRSLLPVPEGTVVRLLDVIGGWHKVRLADGEQGWLPATALETI